MDLRGGGGRIFKAREGEGVNLPKIVVFIHEYYPAPPKFQTRGVGAFYDILISYGNTHPSPLENFLDLCLFYSIS